MKNSNEMFNSLLESREQHIAEQRKKRKNVFRSVISVCSLCLFVLLGVKIWQSGFFRQSEVPIKGNTPGQTGDSVGGSFVTQSSPSSAKKKNTFYTGMKSSEDGADLLPTNTGDTEIIVNEVASEIIQTGFFSLGPDNYCEYTRDELFDYYGIKFDISSVFPDMIEKNTDSYGIFKFSDGRDLAGHNFIWVNPTSGEKVSIEIIKGGSPINDMNLFADGSSPLASTISGEDVKIFHSDSSGQSGYYAEFVHKGLGFAVYGYNFDEDDFVRILSYLISC